MDRTILIATEKPFAEQAMDQIKSIVKDTPGFRIELLENYKESSDLVNAVANVDALVVRSDKVTSGVIDAAGQLKIIVRAGSGYDNVDLEKASDKNIVVMNTPGQNANAVAELAFGMMITMVRGKYHGLPGTELKGKTIGMHGYGNIGKCMAAIAKGFGMNTQAYDPYVEPVLLENDRVTPVNSLEQLYGGCDFISLNIPVNDETRGCVNENLLSIMKDNAVLLNTARKEIIDEDALAKTFVEKPGFRYTSDISPTIKAQLEEMYPDRVFFSAKKMGAQTAEANINAGVAAVGQVIKFFESGDTTFQVN